MRAIEAAVARSRGHKAFAKGGPGDPVWEVELAEAIGEFTHDPLGFAFFAFPWGVEGTPLARFHEPEIWQCENLEAIGDTLRADPYMPVQRAVGSGHGVGKSANVSQVGNWAMSTMPHCRVNATAGTLSQLRTKLIPEVMKWTRLAINQHWWKINKQSIQHALHPDTWRWDFIPWDESNPESFAGLHNVTRRTVLITDEASQIAQIILDTMKGAMTDAETEILLLAYGNRTRNTGWFNGCFVGDEARYWKTQTVDSREVKISNKRLIAQWLEQHGEDSDFFRIRVRGEPPNSGSDQFIGNKLVADARKRIAQSNLTDPLIMGVDPGRQGDRSVIAFRRGLDARSIPWKIMRVDDVIEVAMRAVEEFRKHQPQVCFVDVGGMGWGVYDYMRKLVPTLPGDFGSKPVREPSEELPMMFLNRRAEIWGVMREWLRGGAIPDLPELEQDLIGPNYYHQLKTEKIFLESKEDMKERDLQSPDCADGLALTFALPVAQLEEQVAAIKLKMAQAYARGERGGAGQSRDYDPYAADR